MISISSIRTYMFCPLKLYLQHSVGEDVNNEFILNKTIKELRIDLQDLFQRNLRRLKIDMNLDEIEENLAKNIEEYIKNSMELLKNSISEEDKISEIENGITDETFFNLKILSLKAQKAMISNDKDGNQIAELFFPSSMYSYLMKDDQLEIIGSCDKIEIIDGRYFPINIKSSNPPIKGVWDSDAIELVANAFLIEQEFNTEVFVGFIDYLKLADKRPVVMDAELRKSLFRILNEIKNILYGDTVPEVNINSKKCNNCDYNEICHQNIAQ